jgi:hypothetical protein
VTSRQPALRKRKQQAASSCLLLLLLFFWVSPLCVIIDYCNDTYMAPWRAVRAGTVSTVLHDGRYRLPATIQLLVGLWGAMLRIVGG